MIDYKVNIVFSFNRTNNSKNSIIWSKWRKKAVSQNSNNCLSKSNQVINDVFWPWFPTCFFTCCLVYLRNHLHFLEVTCDVQSPLTASFLMTPYCVELFFSIRNHFVPKEFKRRLLGTLSNEDTLTKTHFAGCNKYGNLCRSSNSALSAAGKTRLDRERAKMCQHEMVREKIGETIFPIPSCNKVCENHCKKSHATKYFSDTFCKNISVETND